MKKIGKKAETLEFVQPSLILQLVNRYLRWVVVLAAGFVLLIGYSFALDTKIAAVQNAAQENLPAKEKIVSDLKVIKQELDRISLEFDTLREAKKGAITLLTELVPAEERYLELFAMTEDLTAKSGMELSSIRIAFNAAPAETPGASRGTDTPQQSTGGLPATIRMMTINLVVRNGNYDTFKQYLDTLERSIRLFDVQSISFAGSSAAADLTGPSPQATSYDVELVTYYEVKNDVQPK